jgi:hypothetical protein
VVPTPRCWKSRTLWAGQIENAASRRTCFIAGVAIPRQHGVRLKVPVVVWIAHRRDIALPCFVRGKSTPRNQPHLIFATTSEPSPYSSDHGEILAIIAMDVHGSAGPRRRSRSTLHQILACCVKCTIVVLSGGSQNDFGHIVGPEDREPR